MDLGKKRACLVWHRRSGKSKTLLNFTTKKAFERVGTYYHAFPEYGQGRKILWDGIDRDGHKTLDYHIPEPLRKHTNKTELKIELINGSIWQIIGADNYDSLVGPNPIGLILDEWAVSDRYPIAWDYFRPILAENGGWAVFPYTPRGRNHGWELYQMAQMNKAWFCQILTVDDTKAISGADIQAERDAGMPEDMIQQEFFCSFLASTGNIVIPFYLIQNALKKDVQYPRSGRIAGLDVARFGDDRSALVIRQGGQIIHVETWQRQDTTFTAGRVVNHYRNKLFDCIAVDAIGLGAGVYDMIKNARVPCVAVNVAEASTDDRFVRLRDQLWWRVREWFEEGACSISEGISLRDKNELLSDIQDIHYEYNLKQQIKIETKDEMKERMGVSPDAGDALCCTFAPGIEYKIKDIDRIPFGIVAKHSETMQQPEYDPLNYNFGGTS
ncbi:MAG: hypothetical protein ABIA66_00185 [Candidatus Omnitrophota bacterium]